MLFPACPFNQQLAPLHNVEETTWKEGKRKVKESEGRKKEGKRKVKEGEGRKKRTKENGEKKCKCQIQI